MIISKEYGPQLDAKDGTIGNLQLIKKFVLVLGDGKLFYGKCGRYTYDQQTATTLCDLFLENNKNSSLVKGLHVEEWWCYPFHFDPVAPV